MGCISIRLSRKLWETYSQQTQMIWNSLKEFSIIMQLYHSLFPFPPSTSSLKPLLALFHIRGFFVHQFTDCCHVHVCVFSFILKCLFILDTNHSFSALLSSRSPPIYFSPHPFHSSESVRFPLGSQQGRVH